MGEHSELSVVSYASVPHDQRRAFIVEADRHARDNGLDHLETMAALVGSRATPDLRPHLLRTLCSSQVGHIECDALYTTWPEIGPADIADLVSKRLLAVEDFEPGNPFEETDGPTRYTLTPFGRECAEVFGGDFSATVASFRYQVTGKPTGPFIEDLTGAISRGWSFDVAESVALELLQEPTSNIGGVEDDWAWILLEADGLAGVDERGAYLTPKGDVAAEHIAAISQRLTSIHDAGRLAAMSIVVAHVWKHGKPPVLEDLHSENFVIPLGWVAGCKIDRFFFAEALGEVRDNLKLLEVDWHDRARLTLAGREVMDNFGGSVEAYMDHLKIIESRKRMSDRAGDSYTTTIHTGGGDAWIGATGRMSGGIIDQGRRQ